MIMGVVIGEILSWCVIPHVSSILSKVVVVSNHHRYFRIPGSTDFVPPLVVERVLLLLALWEIMFTRFMFEGDTLSGDLYFGCIG